MNVDLLFEMAWKSLALAGLALLVLRLLRGRSAAQRSLVAHLGLLALLLLPAATLALPDLEVDAPRAVAQAYDRVAPLPPRDVAVQAEPDLASASVETASSPQWPDLILLGWAIPALALLLITLVAMFRLQRLRARADMLVDPCWLTALAAAQQRLGFKHGTALLTSTELRSPISWGIVRPIIMIDPDVARDVGRAEAIIAHELAHVARLDWLGLLLGRAAAAIFWFNPLVWLLARQAHELSELAADDVVLRSNVPSADYAEVLVGAARHASSPMLLAANGVAPSGSSLGRRVLAILDPTRSRIPAGLGWTSACLAATLAVGTAMAAVDPHLPMQSHVGVVGSSGASSSSAVEPIGERGRYGEIAAARLTALPTPQAQALARAIRRQDWKKRRVEGGTLFSDRRALEPLLLALRDESALTRKIAVWGLSELRPPEAVVPLAALLGDESADVRGQAVRALGDLGAAGQTPAIARLLGDPDVDVRIEAAHALGDLRDPAARPALEAALRDSDRTVRYKAGWALRQISEAEAVLRRHRPT